MLSNFMHIVYYLQAVHPCTSFHVIWPYLFMSSWSLNVYNGKYQIQELIIFKFLVVNTLMDPHTVTFLLTWDASISTKHADPPFYSQLCLPNAQGIRVLKFKGLLCSSLICANASILHLTLSHGNSSHNHKKKG